MSELQERLGAAVGDRYTVEEEIGRGGMGVVYRALDRRLRRKVAIKVLPPELAFRADVRSRFLREAQTAAQLSHPHIVPIYEVDEREGLVYFVMALVEGENLAARLARSPRPDVTMVTRVLRDVADALSAAHARGIVHRDVKPDNILLERVDDRALVTDFGIARAAEGETRLTATGVAVGTPTYMSPEQALGGDEIDGRSDIYSLAVVGYQMLAGTPPFASASTPTLLIKHLEERAPSLLERRPELPPRLVSIIERALEKSPGDRWPDAAAMRDALSDLLRGQQAPPDAVPPSIDRPIDAEASDTAPGAAVAGEAGDAVPRADADSDHAATAPRPRPGGDDLSRVAREMPAVRPPSGASAAAPPHRDVRASGAGLPVRQSAPPPPATRDRLGRGTMPAGGSARVRAPEPPARRSESISSDGLPALPPWMPDSWRDARRQWRASARGGRDGWTPSGGTRPPAASGAGGERGGRERPAVPPLEQKIVAFRRQSASAAIRIGVLAAINAVTTPFVPWFLFPATFLGMRLARRGTDLWADGVRLKDVFGPEARTRIARARSASAGSAPAPLAPSIEESALRLAPRDVLDGPLGDVVRHAADDREVARDAVAHMPSADRGMIPDVLPTIDALAERVGSLAQMMHRLDADVQPDALDQVDRRIAAARAEPQDASGHDRKLALLDRQRATIADLERRRAELAAQLESASLLLQNMRLDLVALRSAGVQASIDSGASPTVEARALSREIGYVLDAAKKIRE